MSPLLPATLLVGFFVATAFAAGTPVTVTECAFCSALGCSSTNVQCITYACDGKCRTVRNACGQNNYIGCKATSLSQIGYDYYTSNCATYRASQVYDPSRCYADGTVGSFYLSALAVNYADQFGTFVSQPCLSDAGPCSDESGTTLSWRIDANQMRTFYVALAPQRRVSLTVRSSTGGAATSVLRGRALQVPTATEYDVERMATTPSLSADHCTSVVPVRYYFTVGLAGGASGSITIALDQTTLSCVIAPATAATTTTTTTTMTSTAPSLTSGTQPTITTSTISPTTTTAAPTSPPCTLGSLGCMCRTLGDECDAPLSCVADSGGVPRCLCLAGTRDCPCRAAAPLCSGGDVCSAVTSVCAPPAGATMAPTPAPTMSLQQQCSAGNCSACIGCEVCLFTGKCGFCQATERCADRVSGGAVCELVEGDYEAACAAAATGVDDATDGTRSNTMVVAVDSTESGLSTGDIIGIVFGVVGCVGCVLALTCVQNYLYYYYLKWKYGKEGKVPCKQCCIDDGKSKPYVDRVPYSHMEKHRAKSEMDYHSKVEDERRTTAGPYEVDVDDNKPPF